MHFPFGIWLYIMPFIFPFSRWHTASQCSLEDHHHYKIYPSDELKEIQHSDQNLVAQYERPLVDHCPIVDWQNITVYKGQKSW